MGVATEYAENETYERPYPPEDMICPGLPNHGKPNMRQSSCLIKQRDNGPCSRLKCQPGQALSGRPDHVVKPKTTKTKTFVKELEYGVCEMCHGKSLDLAYLKRARSEVILCKPCIDASRKQKKKAREKLYKLEEREAEHRANMTDIRREKDRLRRVLKRGYE